MNKFMVAGIVGGVTFIGVAVGAVIVRRRNKKAAAALAVAGEKLAADLSATLGEDWVERTAAIIEQLSRPSV